MTVFAKQSILDIWQGSECPSGLRTLFYHGICLRGRGTRERLRYPKMIIVFTPNLEFPPDFGVMHRSTIFNLVKGFNQGYKKVIKYLIWCCWSSLKLVSAIFYQYYSPNDSPLKTKNVFYFRLPLFFPCQPLL